MDFRHFLLALHLTRGIGKAKEALLIDLFEKQPKDNIGTYPWPFLTLALVLQLDINTKQYRQIQLSYDAALSDAELFNDDFLTYFDSQYPERLRQIFHPPLVLFYKGDIRALLLPALAVVGTREATTYGLDSVRNLLPDVIDSGCAIVSGLAKGIDIMAHQVTFTNGGVPIAVIGTGLDRCYPKSHQSLQRLISQQGLLLSEYPNQTTPRRSHFPDRNRIIAGLSAATLVVEAKRKSGSLITANIALQENRQVLAVPGPIDSELSKGPNELIQVGALPVLNASDIMKAIRKLP